MSHGHPVDVELSLGFSLWTQTGQEGWVKLWQCSQHIMVTSPSTFFTWTGFKSNVFLPGTGGAQARSHSVFYLTISEQIKKRKQEQVECVCVYPGCLWVLCHSSHCTQPAPPLRCLTNTARFNAITLQTVSVLSVRSSDQQSTAHFL